MGNKEKVQYLTNIYLKHTKIERSNLDVNDLKIYINHALENGLILKREYNYISDIIKST